MVKVLMVCLGNICRSPMAEGVFQHLINQANLSDHILVDSAGTAGYHAGERAHGGTLKVLQKHHIAYDGRSRQLSRIDFDQYDYILAMDESNYGFILDLKPEHYQGTIKLFLDYATGVSEREVPDPYYTGGFDHVYDLIENASRGLLSSIRQEHGI